MSEKMGQQHSVAALKQEQHAKDASIDHKSAEERGDEIATEVSPKKKTNPSSSTKTSHHNKYSSSTLVKIPPEMENVVSFPPGCPVLFRQRRHDEEESSFRSPSNSSSSSSSSDTLGLGTVFSVSVDILSREFIHEIELNGRIIDASTGLTKKQMVSEKDLQYAPGCPVIIQNDDGSVIPNLTSNQQILEGSVLFGNLCDLLTSSIDDMTHSSNTGTGDKYSILIMLDDERYLAKHNVDESHVKFNRRQTEGTLSPSETCSSLLLDKDTPSLTEAEKDRNNGVPSSTTLVRKNRRFEEENILADDKSIVDLTETSVPIIATHSSAAANNNNDNRSLEESTSDASTVNQRYHIPQAERVSVVSAEPFTNQSTKKNAIHSNMTTENYSALTTSVSSQHQSEEVKTVQTTNLAVEHRVKEVGTFQKTNADSVENAATSTVKTTVKSINRDRRRGVGEVEPRFSNNSTCDKQCDQRKRLKISHSLQHVRDSTSKNISPKDSRVSANVVEATVSLVNSEEKLEDVIDDLAAPKENTAACATKMAVTKQDTCEASSVDKTDVALASVESSKHRPTTICTTTIAPNETITATILKTDVLTQKQGKSKVNSTATSARSPQHTATKAINLHRRREAAGLKPHVSNISIYKEQRNQTKRLKVSHPSGHTRDGIPTSVLKNNYHRECRRTIDIPSWIDENEFFPYVLGYKGSTIKLIERSTDCSVRVQKKRPKDTRMRILLSASTIEKVVDAQDEIEELLMGFFQNRDQSIGRLMFDLATLNSCMRKDPTHRQSVFGAVHQRDFHHTSENKPLWMHVLDLPRTDDGQYHGCFLRGKQQGETERLLKKDFDCTFDICGVFKKDRISCEPYVIIFGDSEYLIDRAIEFVQEMIARHVNGCYCRLTRNCLS